MAVVKLVGTIVTIVCRALMDFTCKVMLVSVVIVVVSLAVGMPITV